MTNVIKLSEDDAEQLGWEDHPDYEVVETGDWVSEGASEHSVNIVKHISTGLFYSQENSRIGSVHSSLETRYGQELVQVEKKKILVEKWIEVS